MGLYHPPQSQEQDSSGNPLAGAKLFFYEVGTATKKDTYQNKELTVAHTNPVVADAAGRFEPIYTNGAYKVILTTSDDTDPPTSPIWTEDNISYGAGDLFGETESLTGTTSVDSTYDKKHIRCTGTITLNLLDLATAGAGFSFSVQNDGTGVVTIDPSASEQINDASTWTIPPGGGGLCIAGAEWSFIGTMGIVQSLAAGDILYIDANKKLSRLAAGTNGNALVLSSGLPSWALATPATALTSTAASMAINLANGFDFTHTFTENTTLANPTNITVGQKGRIFLTQHASAPKTLAFGSYYKFAGGIAPAVTASNGAIDVLYYDVLDATRIACSLVKGFA
jgi:hypothetical protein